MSKISQRRVTPALTFPVHGCLPELEGERDGQKDIRVILISSGNVRTHKLQRLLRHFSVGCVWHGQTM